MKWFTKIFKRAVHDSDEADNEVLTSRQNIPDQEELSNIKRPKINSNINAPGSTQAALRENPITSEEVDRKRRL